METRSYGMLVVAGLVALGAVGIAFFTTSTAEKSNTTSTVAILENNSDRGTAGDRDSDGVPDWKEVLWGTDPQNPDTDGDGVPDGEEIDTGANPLQEGSDPTARSYSAPKALTSSEALSRELFVGYATSRQDGSLAPEEATTAALAALSANVSPVSPARIYTLGDLSIESDVSLAAYDLHLNEIFRKTLAVREYELTTFSRAVGNDDFSELEPLIGAAAIYTEVTTDLVQTEVPEVTANQHLKMVNALSNLAHATRLLTTWNGDPLDGLNVINNFATAEEGFATAVSLLYAIIDSEK